MDFQNFVDGFNSTACVISVEKKDKGYGDIRIVAGNQKFIETAEHPAYATAPDAAENKFVPGSLYDKYLPKTPDFEDFIISLSQKIFRGGWVRAGGQDDLS